MNFPLSDYLLPVETLPEDICGDRCCLGWNILRRNPDSDELPAGVTIAFAGISEDRGSDIPGAAAAVEEIRSELYRLCAPEWNGTLMDLGNLRKGASLEDTYTGLRDLTDYLRGEQIVLLLAGGSSDLLHATIPNLPKGCPPVRVTTLAPGIGMGTHPLTGSLSPLMRRVSTGNILLHNLGHQACFTPADVWDNLHTSKGDSLRLGRIRTDMLLAEPILRDSRITGITMDAVRSSDAPASAHPSPNGLYAEEICQLASFAGNATHCQVFGVFDATCNLATSQMAAQILWYFVDGFSRRVQEDPALDPGQFVRYLIPLQGYDQTLTFYKSRKTDRYWMEAYCDGDSLPNILACTQADYQTACSGELPDRWMRSVQA